MSQRNVIVIVPVAALLLAVACVAGYSAWRAYCAWGHNTPVDDAAAAAYDEQAAIRAAEPIDTALIRYHEAGSFPVAFHEARALAVDPSGKIYVGGDRAVVRYSGDGKKLAEIELRGEPRCLAVGAFDHLYPDRLYVGMADHVEVYDPSGKQIGVWAPRPQAIFTSITTTEHEVWVADAGNRLVWRFNLAGQLLKPVGEPDASQQRTGFVLTDPHYFDLAAGTDDLVYVVNPRLLHVEGFTHNGEYETAWGKGSPSVKDFFGCCNPAQLAVLPDGGFVTAEKGIPRVKTYSRTGAFEAIVAGPSQLTETPTDLAADIHERVLVLDGRAAMVRVFERNPYKKQGQQ